MKEVGRVALQTMCKRRKIGLLVATVGVVMMFGGLEEYLWVGSLESALQSQLVFIGVFLGGVVLWVILHEGLHGLFFWLYTKRVKFGIKLDKWFLVVPYATSPQSILTRKQMVVTALAPQILTVVMVLMLVASIYSNQPVMLIRLFYWLGIICFLGGAMDIYVTIWLLTFKIDVLVQDTADGIVVYGS